MFKKNKNAFLKTENGEYVHCVQLSESIPVVVHFIVYTLGQMFYPCNLRFYLPIKSSAFIYFTFRHRNFFIVQTYVLRPGTGH